eukprot:9980265-Prorocentrum_lima.AAC.1
MSRRLPPVPSGRWSGQRILPLNGRRKSSTLYFKLLPNHAPTRDFSSLKRSSWVEETRKRL